MAERRDPDRLLEGLNDAQREAVTITSGPLAIIAGAGSGKTRVISHRAAYAIETGVVPADRILLVTFTDKAASEMVERMAALGHRGVMAKTFHAHALAQLRTFWPARHEGAPLPAHPREQAPAAVPDRARDCPAVTHSPRAGTSPTRSPGRRSGGSGRSGGWPRAATGRRSRPSCSRVLYADYERAKARTGEIDFDDMLVATVELLETDAAAAALVRSRKTWFSVDEYQDTNPLAERLLELWLGESRDLAVVGDP